MDEIRKKAENEPKKTEEGPDWEVPRWVFPFVEGIFVMIGIAIGYNCLRSNAGYVDDKEWENMHSNK